MTLAELNTALDAITAFKDKVAYRAFPINKVPALPYICFMSTGSDNFAADNVVFHSAQPVRIELYEKEKNITNETALESKLTESGLFWEREETYIDEEQCFLIIYEVSING